MFSFFRKDKGSTKPVIPDTPVIPGRPATTASPAEPKPARKPAPVAPSPAPKPAPPPAEPSAITSNGFLVEESGTMLAPEVEEAVMLYANGRTGEATVSLNRLLLDHPDIHDPQPWRLLFDIYEATGQRQPFDDLAMDYAVRFERSPPTWRPAMPTQHAASQAATACFAFEASLSPQDKARLEHFYLESASTDTVTLNFSKTAVPNDDAYARVILDCLTRMVASNKAIHLVGSEAFAVRLNAFRGERRLSETLWLLFLMLLQLQGKADEFEAAALEYAIHFEMSPPSYSAPKRVTAEPAQPDTANQPHGHVFPIPGPIGPGTTHLFDELRLFAEAHSVVEIDLAQTTRIDFTMVGLFMDTVMNLAQAGKKIVFKDGNEMVCLLLQMVGIGQYASIHPRIRK